ncbi:MAG: glycosyltransferase [Xanthobacteraceae bacterium]|nr:glycosyltransferase [Xanthobacteraceae bacterium]
MAKQSLRTLSVAHSGVTRDAGRLRYQFLEEFEGLDTHLLVPRVWHEYGRVISADNPDDPGITVHIEPILLPKVGPINWYLHFYPGLRRLIKKIDPDVIHLWEEPWSLVALQACLLRGNASLVLEVDQNILKRLPPPFETIRRFVLSRTSHVLSRHPDASEVVRAVGYTGPITLIGYGVDQTTFYPTDRPQRLSTNKELRLGYVGRIAEEKGLDDVLDAMKLSNEGVTLSIMGDGSYEAALRERIARLGMERRVIFHSRAGASDVARFLQGIDVLVLMSRTTKSWREQFGRVIIEAQACGVPVVGSASGSIPNVVGNGGWIVPERNPGALSNLLASLMSLPGELPAKRAAAIENVEKRFTFGRIARTLADVWIDAAGTRQGVHY